MEFALTAPAFFAMLVGVIECGLLLWTQIGLQHGAEMAARCASINATLCGTTSAVQQYAAQQAFGLNPPSATFTADPSPASGCGYKVSASYAFNFLTQYFPNQAVTISAQSCFPK